MSESGFVFVQLQGRLQAGILPEGSDCLFSIVTEYYSCSIGTCTFILLGVIENIPSSPHHPNDLMRRELISLCGDTCYVHKWLIFDIILIAV